MSLLYYINYAMFSAFITVLTIELGIALYGIASYKKHSEQIRKYLLPMWEVVGTFGLLYVVNFIITYPTLVPTLGIFVLPALIIGALFLIRGAFLIYNEYAGGGVNEASFQQIYSASVIVIYLLIFSILTSATSGIGINLTATGISLLNVVFNPFNFAIFLAMALIGLFMASNIFEDKKVGVASMTLVVAAYIIILSALASYTSVIFVNILRGIFPLVISLLIFAGTVLAIIGRSRYAKALMVAWLFFSINLFGVSEYPYLVIGHNISILISGGVLAQASVLVTTVGGILVMAAVVLFLYFNYLRRRY
ncbi:MAG: hypothetical protein KGH78_03915 [Candidatus Micrarchaeota archaeon]|nr:hypothetical protein [Candidatus Micrarchaeota archaeon]